MPGLLVQLVSRAYENVLFLKRICRADKACMGSQAALFVGIAYLFGPVDFIPGNVPVFGHADEFAFLVGGFLVSRRLAPRPAVRGLAQAPVVPNFFIVGAARCGTTSLFEALGQHPDVFCCPVKEPNHFATELAERPQVVESARRRGVLLAPGMASLAVLPRVAITPDYDTYLSLFSAWAGQPAVGEASTAYLMSPRAAAEIARRRPDARIIVVLRNPVQRALSEAQMHAQLGREAGAGEAPGVIAASLYAPQVRRFLAAFPREQILFLLFEQMLADPEGTLHAVFRHIGVDPAPAAGTTLRHQNQSRPVRFARLNRILFRSGLRDVLLHIMPARLRRSLARRYYGRAPAAPEPGLSIELFRADIEETARLIGQDLSHWLVQRPAPSEPAAFSPH
jgi:hypothetical protein